jgi:signal peptidase I
METAEEDPVTATLEHVEQEPEQRSPQRYSRKLLAGGVVGRIWLWFVAGCLAVTLIPMLFGWRPYVIESGSMQPRIKVGDIVIASPNHDPKMLLGHVTVFQDPDFPSRVKTHRVIRIAKDGRLVTKGDANPTADSQPVRLDKVRGIGRLMVRYAGLPLVWAHTGKWLYLILLGLSLYLSALIVARDREPYEDEELVEDDPADDKSSDAGEPSDADDAGPVVPRPRQLRDQSRLLGMDRRALKRASRRLLLRSTALLGLALILALPTARAAFSAVTRNNTDSWSVPNWDYTTELKALSPYLFWKLDDANGTAADSSGNNHPGTYNSAVTRFTQGVVGALTTDTPNRAVTLKTAADTCINTAGGAAITAQTPVTVIAWIKATAGANGKVIGFEKPQTGVAAPSTGTYDRMLYVDGNGMAWFGVYNNAYFAISSSSAVTDGAWHMLAGTLGPAGMRLYVDGVQVASNTNTAGEATTGWWRVGCGNLAGWGTYWNGTNDPGTDSAVTANRPFNNGSIDEASVHTS